MEGESPATSALTRLQLTTCSVEIASTVNEVIVALSGELDMADADRVGDMLVEAASDGRAIVRVDLAGLTFADSSAVKSILRGATAAGEHGVTYELLNPRGSVQRLLSVTGLVDALTVITEPEVLEGPNSL
jgi:anti-anti-sigma factor